MNFIFVALGGAVGAMLRYAISLIPVKTEFPVLTFLTNIIGAVLIGFIVGMVSVRQETSQHLILFLKVGVCGGFTTFSTFSLEAFHLFEQNKIVMGMVYAVLSIVCCVVGVYVSQNIAQKVFN